MYMEISIQFNRYSISYLRAYKFKIKQQLKKNNEKYFKNLLYEIFTSKVDTTYCVVNALLLLLLFVLLLRNKKRKVN